MKTVIGIIFWVLMAVFIIPSLLFGYQKLFKQQQRHEAFKHIGYSLFLMPLLGLCEILAVITLLFAQLRLFGLAFFCIILPGALYMHIRGNQPRTGVLPPIYVGLHLALLFILNLFI